MLKLLMDKLTHAPKPSCIWMSRCSGAVIRIRFNWNLLNGISVCFKCLVGVGSIIFARVQSGLRDIAFGFFSLMSASLIHRHSKTHLGSIYSQVLGSAAMLYHRHRRLRDPLVVLLLWWHSIATTHIRKYDWLYNIQKNYSTFQNYSQCLQTMF